jgi:DNA-directed RNA polymerase subunit RPC12/RpoP
MFDYHCNCGYDFFMEEGYDRETDAIVCPMCGATHISEEV